MPFDELLAEADRLASSGVFGEPLICQSGQSAHRMSHAEQFMARPSIDDLIAASSLIITHGGATVIQLLIARKPFIAFPNPRGAGDHQTSFLRQVAAVSEISWSSDVNDMAELFVRRRAAGPALIRTGFPRAANVVRQALSSLAAG